MKNDPEKSFHLLKKSFLFLSYVARRGKTIHVIITKDVSLFWSISVLEPFPIAISEWCAAFDMEMIFHSHANKTHFHKEGNMHLASV